MKTREVWTRASGVRWVSRAAAVVVSERSQRAGPVASAMLAARASGSEDSHGERGDDVDDVCMAGGNVDQTGRN